VSWDAVREIECLLWPRERLLLGLMRLGKTPSEVARILGFSRRQRAAEEMRRVISVISFYAGHYETVRRLYRGRVNLDRRQLIAVRMYAAGRINQRRVAELLGFRHRRALCTMLLRARARLAEAGDHEVLQLLRDCAKRRKSLRMRRRRLMSTDAWRDDVKRRLLQMLGKVWYEWGGQDLGRRRADCSGLVLEVLKEARVLPPTVKDMTAHQLSRLFRRRVKRPLPGDLAFYGGSWSRVTHVMFYMGEVDGIEGMVAGMCGGRRNMKASWARKVGAGLWLRPAKYRKDFLGFSRVELIVADQLGIYLLSK